MAPRVSVVLPTYNHGDFIGQSIDSVLEQTLTDFELIVVDDGSEDDTLQRLERYDDPRMSVIALGENRKIPTALNEGFARASGDYWTWTSADNWMLPTCLETLARALDEHPEVGLVYASHYYVGDQEGVSVKEQFDPDRLFGGENIVGPCFMYRRTVAEQVGPYDPHCFGAEDYDMWLRMARRTKVLALADELYVYRYHGNTVTKLQPAVVRRGQRVIAEKAGCRQAATGEVERKGW